MEQPRRLVLRPARGPAVAWAVAGAVLLAAGVWLVVDSAGTPLAWVAVAVFGAVASYFLLQALVPSWFTLVCDEHGLRGRTPWRRLDVAWDQVDLATVDRFVGDPVLRLHLATDPPDVVDVLLPVGADVAALHRFLRDRLGRVPVPDAPTPPMTATTPRSAP